MLFTVKFLKDGCEIRFGFRQYSEMIDFLNIAIDAVDGFDEGATRIIVGKEEEVAPTSAC